MPIVMVNADGDKEGTTSTGSTPGGVTYTTLDDYDAVERERRNRDKPPPTPPVTDKESPGYIFTKPTPKDRETPGYTFDPPPPPKVEIMGPTREEATRQVKGNTVNTGGYDAGDLSLMGGQDPGQFKGPDFSGFGGSAEPGGLDKPFSDISNKALETHTSLFSQALDAKAEGRNLEAGAFMVGALSTKLAWGAYEGASFMIRPWNWIGAGQGMWDLATDKKYFNEKGEQIGSAQGEARSQFMADPAGGLIFGIGGLLGGRLAGQAGGKVVDLVYGKAGKASTLRNITGTVDDAGNADITAQVTTKKLPRGMADTFTKEKPNRLLIIAEEEAVTPGRLWAGVDNIIQEADTRVGTGYKRGLILEMGEGQLDDLAKGKPTTVKGLKGILQDTPADTVGSKSILSGLDDFKELQTDGSARGAYNMRRAGSLGMGMDDVWFKYKTGAQEGVIGPWDFTKPGGTLEGTPFQAFKGKVLAGARVADEAPGLMDDWAVTSMKGKSTPGGMRGLFNIEGWPSRGAQEMAVYDVLKRAKEAPRPPAVPGGAGSGGIASGFSFLKSASKGATIMSGDVTTFSSVSSNYGTAGMGLSLLNRARSRMESPLDIGAGQATKLEPLKLFEYRDTPEKVRPVIKIPEPEPSKAWPPLEDYWPRQPDPDKPKPWDPDPEPEPEPQKHEIIEWIDDPKPPDPEPPRPTRPGPTLTTLPPVGPGGGMWGGPRTAVGSRSRKKKYDVADPLRLIGARTPEGKARRKAWGRMAI